MTLCIASGILISEVALPELGITLRASSFWRNMHDTTATVTLILVPIRAALRWRWIVGMTRRFASWRPFRRRKGVERSVALTPAVTASGRGGAW